jgi:hypothetical protein
MAAVGEPDVLRHPLPVVNLLTGMRIGVGLALAIRESLAIEVLELRRQLAHDARLALRRQARQPELPAHERVPVTHRWSP